MSGINTPTNEFAPEVSPVIGVVEAQKPISEGAPIEVTNPIAVTVPIAIGKDSPDVAVANITDVPKIVVIKPVIGPDFVGNSDKPEEEALFNKAHGLGVVA